MKKAPTPEVERSVNEREVQPVLKPYLFPEREVTIRAASLEEATKIYNSRFNKSV